MVGVEGVTRRAESELLRGGVFLGCPNGRGGFTAVGMCGCGDGVTGWGEVLGWRAGCGGDFWITAVQDGGEKRDFWTVFGGPFCATIGKLLRCKELEQVVKGVSLNVNWVRNLVTCCGVGI